MTREEAINQLKLTSWAQRDQGNRYLADALDMAIKSLEQEPFINIPVGVTNGDVIKAIFPLEVWLQMKAREFNKTWWNAPYKVGE